MEEVNQSTAATGSSTMEDEWSRAAQVRAAQRSKVNLVPVVAVAKSSLIPMGGFPSLHPHRKKGQSGGSKGFM